MTGHRSIRARRALKKLAVAAMTLVFSVVLSQLETGTPHKRMNGGASRRGTSMPAGVPFAVGAERGKAIDLGSRLELFVDDYVIERLLGGAAQCLNPPTRREVAVVTDAPWEGNACHFRSVFRDGDLYRMYYGGMQYDVGDKVTEPHPNFLCYAESKDGIHWTKPQLGMVEFAGSRSNNIVLGEYSAPGCGSTPAMQPFSRTTIPHVHPTPDTRPLSSR
jgi:hypothetical protein